MSSVRLVVVTLEEAGQKLMKFLERRLGRDVPGGRLMRAIRKGEVRVDKKRAKPFDRVEAGQTIRIPPINVAEPDDSAPGDQEPGAALEILSRQGDVLAVDKPAGLPVHGGTGHGDSVASRLKSMFPDAPFAPTPVHRLDRDTTGVLIAALSYEALSTLHEEFRSRRVGKFYLAWTAGLWPWDGPTTLEDRLAKTGLPGKERVGTADPGRGRGVEAGKEARAVATPLVRAPEASLLSIELLTGRTHQIRAQCAERGHPLIGDAKYGGPGCRQGILLHSRMIALSLGVFESWPDWPGRWAVPEDIFSRNRATHP